MFVAGKGYGKAADLNIFGDVLSYQREQDEIGRKRQEKFDEARKAFKLKMKETYDDLAYGDNFDGTGIDSIDSAATKAQRGIRELYEINEFAFQNGFISEAELTGRNNNIKGQVSRIANFTKDVETFVADIETKNKEGKNSILNDMKLKLLEEQGKNVRFTPLPSGDIGVSTLDSETGKVKTVSMNDFPKVFTASNGVNLQEDVDDIIKIGGFNEYILGSKKIKDFDLNSKKVQEALDVALTTKTNEELLDMMYKLDLATPDKLTEGDSRERIDESKIFDFKASNDQKGKIKAALAKEIKDQLALKRQMSFYQDPYALARYRASLTNRTKPLVGTNNIRKEVLTADGESKVQDYQQITPLNGKGINFKYLVDESIQDPTEGETNAADGQLKRALLDQHQAKFGERLDISSLGDFTFKGGLRNMDTGELTFTFGYTKTIPEDLINKIEGGTKSFLFKYQPANVQEANNILRSIGMKGINNVPAEAIKERQQKTATGQGIFSKFNTPK